MKILLIALLALSACGGGINFDCHTKGSCPNDTTPTQSDVDSCTATEAGVCGSQFKALGACAVEHSKCDSNGKSTVDSNSCSVQLAAYFSCCNSNPTAHGCQ